MLRAALGRDASADADQAEVGWLVLAKFVLNVNALATGMLQQKPTAKKKR